MSIIKLKNLPPTQIVITLSYMSVYFVYLSILLTRCSETIHCIRIQIANIQQSKFLTIVSFKKFNRTIFRLASITSKLQ
jgi:hypothetical protein